MRSRRSDTNLISNLGAGKIVSPTPQTMGQGSSTRVRDFLSCQTSSRIKAKKRKEGCPLWEKGKHTGKTCLVRSHDRVQRKSSLNMVIVPAFHRLELEDAAEVARFQPHIFQGADSGALDA